ncbi:hypothetical protein B0H19DRAFT_1083255 [Mycena capillaripes]|nr:hypothetical protein B0H19DRAFT_1083255 [Mycena capillaripes]
MPKRMITFGLEPSPWQSVITAKLRSNPFYHIEIDKCTTEGLTPAAEFEEWFHSPVIPIPICSPLICTVVGAGLGFRGIAAQVAFVHDPLSSPPTYINFGNAYFGLILATTTSATFLINFRIYKMSEKYMRTSMGYGHVMEIVVESAALYLVALVVCIPLSVHSLANVAYPQALVAQLTVGCLTRTNLPHTEVTQGMPPTLLVARVAFGLSRPDTTWQGQDSTVIAFRRNGNSTSEQPSTIVLSSISTLNPYSAIE